MNRIRRETSFIISSRLGMEPAPRI